jgi:endonuclease/exonuclease/phosphatase family metal-dependent hydrolase
MARGKPLERMFMPAISSLRRCAGLAATAFLMALPSGQVTSQESPDIRVMTYNIRYGTANDGENHWDKRKDFLVETIKAFHPDLLGTQETLGFQRDYLAGQFPDYAVLGVGRDDGKEQGEMMALYYRKDRFERLEDGHFWLSESPDKAGSKSWDSSLPRMVTWVRLRDRSQPAKQPLFFFNTHFDHRGPEARLQSARLVGRQIQALAKGSPTIVTGDFNAGEGSPPYKALFELQSVQAPLLRDCYRVAHPQRAENEGTATAFRPANDKGGRIDWIACTAEFEVRSAEIDRTQREGRMPSDHFAVKAILRR